MTISTITASFLAVGRSRLPHDFVFRVLCPTCKSTTLRRHPTIRRSLVCEQCRAEFGRNSWASSIFPYACDRCGVLGLLWDCEPNRLCASCAKAWDEGGRRDQGIAPLVYHDERMLTPDDFLRIEPIDVSWYGTS